MAPPEDFLSEVQQRRLNHRMWLEIEGIPDVFGNFSAGGDWWTELPTRERFLRVLDLAAEAPNFSSQRLDHAGGRVSLGTCGFVAVEREGVLHQLFGTRRAGTVLILDKALSPESLSPDYSS